MNLGGSDKAVRQRYGIARWRIDSFFERFIAKKADSSKLWKKTYVYYYRLFDKEYFKNGMPHLRKACECFLGISEPDSALIEDMVYSLHRFGCTFEEYFLFGYQDLNAEGRARFLTDKLRYEVYYLANEDSARNLLNDKFETYRIFGSYFCRDVVEVREDGDYDKLLEFVSKHDEFIAKPIKGQCGKGVTIYREVSQDCVVRLLHEFLDIGGVLVEGLIDQSDEMAAFHQESVNTVRMPVFRTKDGCIVVSPFFRMGRGKAIVDNGAQGGIIAGIDSGTGIVCTAGYDEMGGQFLYHPDSGRIIAGYKIPRWDEALDLVGKLSGVVEGLRYIAWDLALTDHGWVVVEGNAQGQFLGQYATRYGIREQVDEILDQLG